MKRGMVWLIAALCIFAISATAVYVHATAAYTGMIIEVSPKEYSVYASTTAGVSEKVTCGIWGSTKPQQCYSEKGRCMTAGSDIAEKTQTCTINVSGKTGEVVEWKSSCGGYATTTTDGYDESAKFECPGESTTCRDTDDGVGGVNYYMKGTTYFESGQIATDYCEDDKTLIENHCAQFIGLSYSEPHESEPYNLTIEGTIHAIKFVGVSSDGKGAYIMFDEKPTSPALWSEGSIYTLPGTKTQVYINKVSNGEASDQLKRKYAELVLASERGGGAVPYSCPYGCKEGACISSGAVEESCSLVLAGSGSKVTVEVDGTLHTIALSGWNVAGTGIYLLIDGSATSPALWSEGNAYPMTGTSANIYVEDVIVSSLPSGLTAGKTALILKGQVKTTNGGYWWTGTDTAGQVSAPECKQVGMESEGWYVGDKLIVHDKCACVAVCRGIDTKSEGWYNSCSGSLIQYAECGEMKNIEVTIGNESVRIKQNIEEKIVEIISKGIETTTKEKMRIEGNKLSIGQNTIDVLPERAKQIAMATTKIQKLEKIELKEFDGRPVYEITGTKTDYIFWIFPVQSTQTVRIDASTGESCSISNINYSAIDASGRSGYVSFLLNISKKLGDSAGISTCLSPAGKILGGGASLVENTDSYLVYSALCERGNYSYVETGADCWNPYPQRTKCCRNYVEVTPDSGSCKDSDGGKKYNVKGETVTRNGYVQKDFCRDSTVLEENYCDGEGLHAFEDIKCPYGCKDGACIGHFAGMIT